VDSLGSPVINVALFLEKFNSPVTVMMMIIIIIIAMIRVTL